MRDGGWDEQDEKRRAGRAGGWIEAAMTMKFADLATVKAQNNVART